MHKQKNPTAGIAKLRRKAEGRLDSGPDATRKKEGWIPPPTERILHELEVHRIELQMQNEELRRAAETLEASMAEYADLYDFAPVGYFTLDRFGAIKRLNLSGARLLGVERGLVLRRHFDRFVSDDNRCVFEAFLGQIFDLPGPRSCELAIEPSGSHDLVHVRMTATLADDQSECRVLAMDVTDETKAVRALRESELRFRTLVDAMEDSVITVDLRGVITSVRSKQLQKLGLSPAAFVGKTAAELYEGNLGATYAAAHARGLAGESVVYEWKHELAGECLQMQTVVSPLRDADGQITGSLDVSRDVTELKRLHDQVLLSDRLSSLGILAAGIAHEINNPLAVVIGNLDATLDQLRRAERDGPAPDLPTTIETLGDCLESAERMGEIVRDLKVFSRSDEERHALVDLRDVVKASLKLVKNEIRHRATLVTEYDDVPLVLGNEARIGQVVLNLLVNAAQSLPDGDVDGNAITVRTRTHVNGWALLEVCDTGPGIPDPIMAHIFEPFFTTKPIGVGTGLGLAISREIVTGLGEQITVDTELGKGTRFRVLLPADTSGPADLPHRPALPRAGGRGRILLIDDDAGVLKTISRTLSERHDVVPVLRAREALERISAGETFDLVISDVMMPEMTGMELFRALEDVAPQHARRMIFLTGGAFTPRAREFLSQIDNLCFDKPFDRQSLLTLVDRFIAPDAT